MLKIKRIQFVPLLGSLLLLLSLTARAEDDPRKILSNLQKKYESVQNVTVKFKQEVEFGVTGAQESFKGTMVIKKGNKYRIELEHQTIVTDGVSVWSYSNVNNQVLIDRYHEDPNSFTPDKVLVNVPDKFLSTLLTPEKTRDRELSVLKLIPKNKDSNVQWIKMWVDTDENTIRKVQIMDISDNLTTYTVEDLKFNSAISDSTFQLQTPQGAQVIDLR
jgi:chaperone LolA